ncbi:MAG: thrombospondin type 3 repeat-containing protein, partial [Polyangiales bacterium]
PTGDSDSDGVGDALDLCGGTPFGAAVWSTGEWIGCAAGQWRNGGGGADYDRDGVGDLQDRCRRTPVGVPVWPYGDWIGCAAGEHREF